MIGPYRRRLIPDLLFGLRTQGKADRASAQYFPLAASRGFANAALLAFLTAGPLFSPYKFFC
jgi:hypothetical protein